MTLVGVGESASYAATFVPEITASRSIGASEIADSAVGTFLIIACNIVVSDGADPNGRSPEIIS